MARSYPWVLVTLLWTLLGFGVAQAAPTGSRSPSGPKGATAPGPASSGAASPASPASPGTASPSTASSGAASPGAASSGAASPASPGAASPAANPATAPSGTPTTAVSGSSEPPPAEARADQIVEYATGLFKQQRYSEAGDALQLAYQREPRPIFLFNVGQTYRKAGRYADALAIYKRFIALAPEHPLHAEARAYEHTLAALVEQQERTSQIEMSLMDKQAEANMVRQNLTLEQRKTEEAQSALFAEKARNKPLYRRPWFLVLVGGAAVAALGIGLGIGLWNNSVGTPGMNQQFNFH